MTDETKPANRADHGDFERSDIGAAPILYFLLGLVVFLVIIHFVVTGVFDVLNKRDEAQQQTAVSPLVTNAPVDTRHLPPDYKGNYGEYLEKNFPTPQLEIDERTELNGVRLREEQTLSTYGYVDEKAGTVRIPIERAMDLIAQRGLPVRSQGTTGEVTPAGDAKIKVELTMKAQPAKKKGSKK